MQYNYVYIQFIHVRIQVEKSNKHLKNNAAKITVPNCGRLLLILTNDNHTHSLLTLTSVPFILASNRAIPIVKTETTSTGTKNI